MAALRRATRTECLLGEAGFVEKLETKFQVRLRPLQPGLRPKGTQEFPVEIARQAGA